MSANPRLSSPSTSASRLLSRTPGATRPVGSVRDEIENARAALAMAGSVLRRDDLLPARGPLEPDDVVGALAAARAAICHDLRSGSVSHDRRPHLATALVHLGQVRVAIREAEAAARTAANRRLSTLLDRLRTVVSVSELIEALPGALADLGYDRVMVSQLLQGRWLPLTTYVRDNPDQADEMIAIGRDVALRVDPRLAEYDMLDRKRPILILDTLSNGRVHPDLLALTDVRSYVGAPIVVDTGVAGFLHADCTYSGRRIDPSDALLLATAGEVLAFALEKAVLTRRLQRITDLVRDPDEELAVRIEQVHESGPGFTFPTSDTATGTRATARALSPRLRHLSPRELQVLHYLAEGASNTSIAIQMGIAETTVKTHVKHVIRKSGAANRAEAIALYLRPPTHERRP